MGSSVFLSFSAPVFPRQERFIELMTADLRSRGLEPRTLGVTDYDSDDPLPAIRRVLLETNGLLVVAFRRSRLAQSPESASSGNEERWITSPYCHIEAAMAFQHGIPIVVLRERGVLEEGVLVGGMVGPRVPPFDLEQSIPRYFQSTGWIQTVDKWKDYVRSVIEKKGHPSKLY